MANNVLAYRSSISVSNIKNTVSSLGKGIKRAQSSATSLSRSISRRNEIKRQSISTRADIFQKRREAVRRREQEDIVEASGVTGTIRRTGKVAMNSTKGFLGRILDYVGTLLVGWAIINLPTIIRLGQVLIGRIQKLTGIMSNFIKDTTQFLFGFGQLLNGTVRNLISFDFTDSQGRVSKAMEQMRSSFTRMEDSIFDAIRILTEPIDFETEKDTGEPGEPTPPGESTPPAGNETPSTGTREQKALLDAIAFAEGTRDQPHNGYRTLFGFGQFNDYSRHPDKVVRSGGYASAAAGRYQFMPGTFNRLAKKLGLKDFSPASQDKAALELARELGITENILKSEGISSKVSGILGRQWASFPGSPFGQPTKSLSSIQKAYQKSLGSQTTTTTQRVPTSINRPLISGDVLTDSIGRGVQFIQIGDVMGAPRRGGRTHQGIDIQCPANTCIALRLDCEVMFAGWENPADHRSGYGLVIDVWVPELGVQLRFGHCAGFFITEGKVPAGKSFARVGSTGASTGPHIHFEYTRQRGRSAGGSDGDPSPYVPYILLTNKPNYSSFSVPGKRGIVAASAQISIEQSRDVKDLKRERKDNVLTVPLPQRAQNKPVMLPVGESSGMNITSDDELNRFITQKLLLDLAYT